jgi:PAS domain S-box-containing protein
MSKSKKNIIEFAKVHDWDVMHKLFYNTLKTGILVIKNDFVHYANNSAVNTLEYTLNEIKELCLIDICTPIQPDNLLSSDKLDILLRTCPSSITIYEWLFKTKSNKSIPCELNLTVDKSTPDTFVLIEILSVNPRQNKKRNKAIEALSEERESLNEELRATLDELVQVNKQLVASESWNKSIVDNIPLGLTVLNKGNIEYINNNMLNILVNTAAEIKKAKFSETDFAIPEEIKKIEKFKKTTFREQNVSSIEFWLKSNDGKRKYVRNLYVKLEQTGSLMIITTDLTNEKLKETEINFANERLEFAIEANNSFIWDIDLSAGNNKPKENIGKLFGYNSKDMIKDWNMWVDMIHPDDRDSVLEELYKHFDGHVPFYEAECRISSKNGDWKWVITRGKVFNKDKDGHPIRFIGMFIDISMLRIAEEKLAASEKKFRSIIQHLSDMIFLVDNQGTILFESPSVSKVLGYEPNYLVGKNGFDFIHSKDIENVKIELQNVITRKNDFKPTELRLKHKDGSWIYTEMLGDNLSDHSIEGGILLTARDITEHKANMSQLKLYREHLEQLVKIRTEELEQQKTQLENALVELKRTQAQLIQSEKMASLGVLTAGVAHEINNPVNYISTAVEGLKMTLADVTSILKHYEKINKNNVSEKLHEIEELKKALDYPLLQEGINVLVNNMSSGIERITDIVKSLRTFARVDENELKLCNIHEIIDATLIMLQPQIKNRIDFIKSYSKLPKINCYPGKLNQVFMNLLSNAIQAIQGQGTITIETSINKHKQILSISISDTGIGIPVAIKEKIFEPFFTTKDAGKGTGLGLSITYGIVQQHKGSIDVKSEQGKGSEFIINLPLTLK